LRPIARADVTAAALTGAYELKASLVAARAGDAVATWERRMMNPWRREPRCPTGVSLHVPTAACCDGGVGPRIGSLIGAVGGLVFILINAGALGQPASSAIRLSGIAIFAGVLWYAVIRTRRWPSGPRPTATSFRIYWVSVIGEVIAIPVGAQVLVRLHQSVLTPTWVVFVVGVHFLPFARAFATSLFTGLGIALITVAVIGGAAALKVGPRGAAWAGVVAGAVLLAFAAVAAQQQGRHVRTTEHRP
jgi:hypothetical protein